MNAVVARYFVISLLLYLIKLQNTASQHIVNLTSLTLQQVRELNPNNKNQNTQESFENTVTKSMLINPTLIKRFEYFSTFSTGKDSWRMLQTMRTLDVPVSKDDSEIVLQPKLSLDDIKPSTNEITITGNSLEMTPNLQDVPNFSNYISFTNKMSEILPSKSITIMKTGAPKLFYSHLPNKLDSEKDIVTETVQKNSITDKLEVFSSNLGGQNLPNSEKATKPIKNNEFEVKQRYFSTIQQNVNIAEVTQIPQSLFRQTVSNANVKTVNAARSKRSNYVFEGSKSRYSKQRQRTNNKVNEEVTKTKSSTKNPTELGQGKIAPILTENSFNFLKSSSIFPSRTRSNIKTPSLKAPIREIKLMSHKVSGTKAHHNSNTKYVQSHPVTKLTNIYTHSNIPERLSTSFKRQNSTAAPPSEERHGLNVLKELSDSPEVEEGVLRRIYEPELDLNNISSNYDLSNDNINAQIPVNQNLSDVSQLPINYLIQALVNLLSQRVLQTDSIFVTSTPILKFETIFETQEIPLNFGSIKITSTLSRPVTTVTKTEYELITSTLPVATQPLFMNQILPYQSSVTSSPVVVSTDVTSSISRVIKLSYGNKVVMSTLYTSTITPTVTTTYITSTVQVQPSMFYDHLYPLPYIG